MRERWTARSVGGSGRRSGGRKIGRKLGLGAALAAGLGLVGLGTVAAARPDGGCGGPGGHGGLERLERKIAHAGLPEETRAAVYARIDEARGARRSLDGALAEAHARMRSLMDAETPDAAAVLAEADRLGALQTEMRKLELGTLLDVRALLTPEQWEPLRPGRRGPRVGGGEATQS